MGKAKKRALHKSSLKPYSKPAQTRKLAHSIHKTPQNSSGIQQRPIIPFESHDNILLVGEGDFSFSRSLLEHHNCASVYATSYDTRSAVLSKYPQAAGHTKALEEENCKIEYGVDATKIGRAGGSGGSKGVRKRSWNKIVFNFPHVGGLTKDVNRQVRANQGISSHGPTSVKDTDCQLARANRGFLQICTTTSFSNWPNYRNCFRRSTI